MSQHTPVKSETCLDCKVLPPFSIVLCPMHAAAPQLKDELRREHYVATGVPLPHDDCDICALLALLKEIEG